MIDPTNLITVQGGGAFITLDFFYFDTDDNDSGEVTVTFLDSSSAVISSTTTGVLPNTATNGTFYDSVLAPWTPVNLSEPIPDTAESIQIDIITGPRLGGSATNVFFDSFSAEVITEIFNPDSDEDGLLDSYEQTIIDADPGDAVTGLADVMGTGADPAITDFDMDGSNDAEELANSTDPLDSDSDDDGLFDGVETNSGFYDSPSDTGTDPLDSDSDDDGLLDGVETYTETYISPSDTGTDPLDPDWDFDGYNDGIEVRFSSDAFDELSLPGAEVTITNGGFEDPVIAVSTEGVPVSGGTVSGWSVVTNEMWVIDGFDTGSAGDPVFAIEGTQFLTSGRQAPNPDAPAGDFVGGNAATMSARQDVDVTSFAADIDAEARTVLVNFDWFDNDPYDTGKVNVRFLDGSGNDLGRYLTGVTGDSSVDWQTSTLRVYPPALTRIIRITLIGDNFNDAGVPSGVGTARNAHFDNIIARLAFVDSDSDDMADDWEVDNGLDPDEISDASGNEDADTLNNLQEFQAGTNPNKADTDDDSFNDDVELAEGTDPLDAESFPIPASPVVSTIGFNLAGDLELSVSGLDPTKTYQLLRGIDLASFPDVVESKVPAGESDVFTDDNPPAGKAFYIVEEVAP